MTSREVRVVSGTPAYAGTAVTELTPGTTSNETSGLGARRRLLGTGRIDPRVAGRCSRTTFCWPRGVAYDELGPRGVGQRLAVLAVPAVDDRDLVAAGRRAARRAARRWSGVSVMTTSAARISSRARTVSSPGSPGPVPTNATEPTRPAAPLTVWSADAAPDAVLAGARLAV